MSRNSKTTYQTDSNSLPSSISNASHIRHRRYVARLRGFLALALVAPALPAMATTRWEIQAGPSYMDSNSTATVFVESVFNEQRIGSSRFTWSPDVSLGWIDGRDVQRFRHNRYTTEDSIALIAGGLRLHYGDAGDWYRRLFVSFQPVLHGGRTQALSSAYEFASTIGWQGKHFSFQIRHISNGSLHEPNRGETMVLAGIALGL
ncbi:MAG: lipid A 3-O-deacylase [Rhodanobacter sp.]